MRITNQASKKAPSTVGEWDEEIQTRSEDELVAAKQALETLKEWPAFREGFAWTRIFVLIGSIENEQKIRVGRIHPQPAARLATRERKGVTNGN